LLRGITAAKESGGLGGALGGGEIGAELGASLGPYGAAGEGIWGSLVGGIAGKGAVEQAIDHQTTADEADAALKALQ